MIINPFWNASNDPNWSNVVSLCHFDSSSGTPRTYVQESSLGSAILNNSGTDPDVSATQSKFGGFSLFYSASPGGRIVGSQDVDYQMGSGDFTIEWWQRLNSISSQQGLMDMRDTTLSEVAPCVFVQATGVIVYFVSNTNQITSAANTLIVSTQQHIALARSGSSTKLFVEGTQAGSTYSDSNNYNVSSRWTLGAFQNGGLPAASSYFDEFRITKGVARYTSNFTPPISAFPNS